MLAEARSGRYRKERTPGDLLSPVLNGLLGPFARFLAGSMLIAGSLMWANENELLVSMDQIREFGEQGATVIQQQVSGETTNSDSDVSTAIQKGQELLVSADRKTEPFLAIFNSFDSLIAGLVLVRVHHCVWMESFVFCDPCCLCCMFWICDGHPLNFRPFLSPTLTLRPPLSQFCCLLLESYLARSSCGQPVRDPGASAPRAGLHFKIENDREAF